MVEPSATDSINGDAILGLVHLFQSEKFQSQNWQRQPYIAKALFSESEINGLLDLEALDELVLSGGLRGPDLQILDNGGVFDVPDISVLSQAADIDRFVHEIDAGKAFRVQHLENYIRSVGDYCKQVAEQIGYPVTANAYVSPVDADGLSPHYDASDIFVLQISGSKDWFLYPEYSNRRACPLYEDRFDPTLHRPTAKPQNVHLTQGDVLYLPRGFMHAASARAELSIHLTFSVLGLTWIDLINVLARKAAQEQIGLRKLVPSGAGGLRASEGLYRLAEDIIEDVDLLPYLDSTIDEIGNAHRAHKPKTIVGELVRRWTSSNGSPKTDG